MKPRTKLQKAVAEQSARLPKLTDWQTKYAIRHCFEHYAVKRQNRHICSNCGADCGEGGKCPHCGMPLKAIETRKRKAHYVNYFAVVTTIADYQVVRYFICHAHYRLGEQAKYHISEVVQKWITSEGKLVVMAKPRTIGWYLDNWVLSSDLSIRADIDNPAFNINAFVVARPKVMADIKRNGFVGKYYGMAPETLFEAILSEPKCETLLKAGQHSLLQLCAERPSNLRYFNAMKIAIRNNYIVKDAQMWVDYISLLEQCGKDTRNAHYICPTDLKFAHDHYLKKRNEIEEKARIKREREEALEEEPAFRKMKSKYFGIEVTDGTIVIRVLESVIAHVEEGAKMHHCVGRCHYAMKQNSLILSARLSDGTPLETIEVDLANLKIAQCRGLQNQTTPYHEAILKLMTANMPLIAKRKTA